MRKTINGPLLRIRRKGNAVRMTTQHLDAILDRNKGENKDAKNTGIGIDLMYVMWNSGLR